MKKEITNENDYSPFNMLGEMDREVDHMMDVFLRNPASRLKNDFLPTCEVNEKDGHYMVSFDIPGIPRDEIKVDLAEGKLHVYGERRSEHVDGGYTERRYGKFERYMSLPINVTVNDAEAIFEDGVLTVSLKKTGETKMKRLEVGNRKTKSIWSGLMGDDKTKSSVKDSKESKMNKIA